MAASKSTGEQPDFEKQGLYSIVECPICLEMLCCPKTLPCDHSFCSDCLADTVKDKLLWQGNDNVVGPVAALSICCPVCQKIHEPIESISSFKVSIYVTQILDIYHHHNKTSKESVSACKCRNTAAARFRCIRCQERFCKNCSKTKANNLCRKSGSRMETKLKHAIFACQTDDKWSCMTHSLRLDYLCTNCNEPVCLDCILTGHRSHLTTKIALAKKEAKELADTVHLSLQTITKEREKLARDATNNLDRLVVNEKKFVEELMLQKRKVQGLLSCIFDKAEKYYINVFETNKATLLQGVSPSNSQEDHEQARIFCDSLKNTTDLSLVFQMRDMKKMCRQLSVQMEEINSLKGAVSERRRFNQPFSLNVDEKFVFESIINLFSKFDVVPYYSGKFLPHDFTFDAYQSGKYPDGLPLKNDSASEQSVTERRCYNRDFLLKFQLWDERPNFPEDILGCTLLFPHHWFEPKSPTKKQ